ncbi:unnamed protein product [Urochloa humidicola]
MEGEGRRVATTIRMLLRSVLFNACEAERTRCRGSGLTVSIFMCARHYVGNALRCCRSHDCEEGLEGDVNAKTSRGASPAARPARPLAKMRRLVVAWLGA